LEHKALRAIALVAAAGALASATFALWRATRVTPPEPFTTFTLQALDDTVRAGETMSALLRRHRIDPGPVFRALAPFGLDSTRVGPGTPVVLKVPAGDSIATEIGFRRSREERLILTFARSRWEVESLPIGWHGERAVLGGYLDQTYQLVTDSIVSGPRLTPANRDELLTRLADVFAWQVDFTREVVPGDRFRVVVDLDVSDDAGQDLRTIEAVELTLEGHRLEAFWFRPLRGVAGYYDQNGRSLRRPFLRAPLEFRRISSTFATMRLHPILPLIRAHQGVDYAAPAGTPVVAAGAGQVTIAGPSGQFGNLVEVDHGNGVSTRYAHLSAFGPAIRPGQRVIQGTVLGFVGQTGLATAPHLHYEFLVNGVPRDLRWLDVDAGDPISPALMNTFEAVRDQLREQLRPSDRS
jgi:murein DD-endopeptidase MepM/ murein hydrolase activator NlpD